MTPLTPRQKQTLAFLRQYRAKHGYMPTPREIGEHLGITKMNTRRMLSRLMARGKVRKTATGRYELPGKYVPEDDVIPLLEAMESVKAIGSIRDALAQFYAKFPHMNPL